MVSTIRATEGTAPSSSASAAGSGTDLTLMLTVRFQPAFGGNLIQYLEARDKAQNNSGWQASGVWNAMSQTPAGPIAVGTMTPARGKMPAGSMEPVTFTVADTKGAADIGIVVEVGPEVVGGSTRMKAGTAQKLILNTLTTGAMTRLGYVFDNLMVNVTPKNEKLTERAIGILQMMAKIPRAQAIRALKAAGKSVPVALVMLLGKAARPQAEKLLRSAHGNVRQAVEAALDSR